MLLVPLEIVQGKNACHTPRSTFFFLFFFAEVGISEITVVMNAALHGDVIVIDVHKSGKMFKGPLKESQLPIEFGTNVFVQKYKIKCVHCKH